MGIKKILSDVFLIEKILFLPPDAYAQEDQWSHIVKSSLARLEIEVGFG